MTRASARRILVLQALLMFLLGPAVVEGQQPATGAEAEISPGTVTYVTVRVETATGDSIRLSLKEGRTGTIELLTTGERYGITPRATSDADEARLEVARLAGPAGPAALPLGSGPQTLTTRVGFPSFPAVAGLFQIELESIEVRRAQDDDTPRITTRQDDPSSSDFELSDQCCVTCGDIMACGCAVGAPCGSCCDCCAV